MGEGFQTFFFIFYLFSFLVFLRYAPQKGAWGWCYALVFVRICPSWLSPVSHKQNNIDVFFSGIYSKLGKLKLKSNYYSKWSRLHIS